MYANFENLGTIELKMKKKKEELESYSSVISFENTKGGIVDDLNEINSELELLKSEVIEIYSKLIKIFSEMPKELHQTDLYGVSLFFGPIDVSSWGANQK